MKPREDSFRGLVLLDGHRETVQALVRTHFEDKHNLSEHQDYNEHDIVQGKGTGLIVLLHGVPGVGKTSTAECVADAEGKPLFPITCGDLGLTAKEVEKELERKFSLAQRWNCILLLDEADVFLAERVGNDLERNSIVSVSLRVLEYYTGILFLTTNRVGVLDEAVVSRIHAKLYYPPLEKQQALEIWKANIDRLRRNKSMAVTLDRKDILKFAKRHFDLAQERNVPWNGRQIRNAFQTAAALARYDAAEEALRTGRANDNPNERAQLKLTSEYFVKVANVSLNFDNYITAATGFNASERANQNSNRYDEFSETYSPFDRSYTRRASGVSSGLSTADNRRFSVRGSGSPSTNKTYQQPQQQPQLPQQRGRRPLGARSSLSSSVQWQQHSFDQSTDFFDVKEGHPPSRKKVPTTINDESLPLSPRRSSVSGTDAIEIPRAQGRQHLHDVNEDQYEGNQADMENARNGDDDEYSEDDITDGEGYNYD